MAPKAATRCIACEKAHDGAKFLGVRTLEVLDLTDTQLAKHAPEMARVIEGALARFEPDVVLSHSDHDQHQDHRAVFRATFRASRQRPSVLCFESPSSTADFSPAIFVDIEEYLDIKITGVGIHRDQRTKLYMAPELVKRRAIFRGSQGKVRYAEGFEAVRLLSLPGPMLGATVPRNELRI